MSITRGRYFVRFSVKGLEGHFWTDCIIWDPGKKSLTKIFEIILDQAQADIKTKIHKVVPIVSIDIESFNLIEGITEIKLEHK